jgi:sugar transferase
MSKRMFDIVVAAIGLIVLSPIFVVVAILIWLDSRGSIFFRQERVGKGLRPFSIYKFRTMRMDADRHGGQITVGEDPRITRVGRVLRKAKLDELPQLINVLKGEMSFVGPRPEVPRYVEMFRNDYEHPCVTVMNRHFSGSRRTPNKNILTTCCPISLNSHTSIFKSRRCSSILPSFLRPCSTCYLMEGMPRERTTLRRR